MIFSKIVVASEFHFTNPTIHDFLVDLGFRKKKKLFLRERNWRITTKSIESIVVQNYVNFSRFQWVSQRLHGVATNLFFFSKINIVCVDVD